MVSFDVTMLAVNAVESQFFGTFDPEEETVAFNSDSARGAE